MIQRDRLIDGEGEGRGTEVRDGEIGEAVRHRANLVRRSFGRGEAGPDFGHADGGMGVDQAETVILAEMETPAIPVPCTVPLPCRLFISQRARHQTAGRLGRIGENVLHIAPTEARICVKHQGRQTGGHWGGGGCATEAVGVIRIAQPVVTGRPRPVGGHRACRGGNEDVRAVGRITGDCARRRRCRHRDRGARRVEGFAHAVDLVISCGLDVDGPEPAATVQQRSLEPRGVGIETVVGITAVAVVGDIETAEAVQSRQVAGPVGVDVVLTFEDADGRDLRLEGDADTAAVIVGSGDQACDRSAVSRCSDG